MVQNPSQHLENEAMIIWFRKSHLVLPVLKELGVLLDDFLSVNLRLGRCRAESSDEEDDDEEESIEHL